MQCMQGGRTNGVMGCAALPIRGSKMTMNAVVCTHTTMCDVLAWPAQRPLSYHTNVRTNGRSLRSVRTAILPFLGLNVPPGLENLPEQMMGVRALSISMNPSSSPGLSNTEPYESALARYVTHFVSACLQSTKRYGRIWSILVSTTLDQICSRSFAAQYSSGNLTQGGRETTGLHNEPLFRKDAFPIFFSESFFGGIRFRISDDRAIPKIANRKRRCRWTNGGGGDGKPH